MTLQNWSSRIAAETSGFGYDLVVPLVVMHDQWCVASSTDFQLWRAGRPHFERPLAAGDTYFLEVVGKGAVFILTVVYALLVASAVGGYLGEGYATYFDFICVIGYALPLIACWVIEGGRDKSEA